MDEWILVLYENGQVKIRHQLQNASFHGEVVITVEFEFHDDTDVLTLSNIFVKTAIQLIKDEFDEYFGTNGLRNEIFTIEDILTATVVEYEMSDYGEREHDDDIGDDDDDDEDDKNNDNDDVNEDDDNNDNDDVIDIIRRWVGHDNMDIVRRWVGQDYDGDEEESEEEEEEEEDDDDDDDDDEDEVNYRPDPQSRD